MKETTYCTRGSLGTIFKLHPVETIINKIGWHNSEFHVSGFVLPARFDFWILADCHPTRCWSSMSLEVFVSLSTLN